MQKGHDVLIDAAGLAKEEWSVTIVGEGFGRDRLEKQAAAVAAAGWRSQAGEPTSPS